MNPSSDLSDPFSVDYPVTTDAEYVNAPHFSHVTGFSTDEVDSNQRVGAFASMSVTNGVMYNAQQSAMHDVQFPLSNTFAMTPPDSCSDSFSPTPGPLFTYQPHQLPYERMTDYRRVPVLQPPAGMTAPLQVPGSAMSSFPTFMGRNNAFSPSYALQRGSGLSSTAMHDVSRAPHYTTTPRGLEGGYDRTQSTVFQPMTEPTQRSQPHVETQSTPPFEPTDVLESIVAEIGGTQQRISPELHAKMGQNFFTCEGKWTCYRRNYFQVTCSWTFEPFLPHLPLYLCGDQGLKQIRSFAIAISAIVNGSYSETRELVQHTAKRDKQSETKPGRVILQPAAPISLLGDSAGNGSHSSYPMGSQSMEYNSSYPGAPQPCQPPTQHTFMRIQFQKATANNGKRRAQQQFYNVVVELQAEIAGPVGGDSQWVTIARRRSSPMVVRGRSPSHYKDGRRDSTASMGPDGGSSDGSAGSLPPSMAQTARSHLLMYDTSHRSGLYGRTDYRQMTAPEPSPVSDSPLISSSSSSGFDYPMVNDTMDPMDTLKTSSSLDAYHDPIFAGVSSHQQQRQPNTAGYDPVYSTYARYDPNQNGHSLCT